MAKTLIKVDKQTDLAASQYAEGVTAAIAAVQSDVDGNEADADAAIAAEAEAREAADTAEAAARAAADNAETAAREAAITALQADVDQNEADADSAIAAVASDLSEYETSNDAALAVETGRIDAILEASDADKDSFAEIVTLINSVDTENDQAFCCIRSF